ncbi:MAG: hypothetical protein ACREHD_12370, partial [Pirellulales bacterium]
SKPQGKPSRSAALQEPEAKKIRPSMVLGRVRQVPRRLARRLFRVPRRNDKTRPHTLGHSAHGILGTRENSRPQTRLGPALSQGAMMARIVAA